MSDVDKLAEAVNNIAQAFSDLNSGSDLHGASGFREEIARLKAINAKLSGDVTKKTVELQRQHEEIRILREELHFKDAKVKELRGSLEHAQKAAESISKNNAHLRSEIYDVKCARDEYRRGGIELRDVLTEIRRALDDYDNEED